MRERYVFDGQVTRIGGFTRADPVEFTEEELQKMMDRCAENTMLITSAINGELTNVTHLGPFLRRFEGRLAAELGQETASEVFERSATEELIEQLKDENEPSNPQAYENTKCKEMILPRNKMQQQ